MTLRLNDEQTEALRAASEHDGRSMQQTALLAIDDYLARRRRISRVSKLAAEAATDYAETLRRLGE